MPKLHDLCQQFWEEILASPTPEGQNRSVEEVVDIAYSYLQTHIPRDADVLKRHLLIIAKEMQLSELRCENIEQLTESLFG